MKVALVTGANKGIGYSTAQRLGELGMKVLVGARNEEHGKKAVSELRDKGLDVEFLSIEIDNAESVQRAFEEVKSRYKRLDVLVNNAAVLDYENRMHPIDMARMRNEFNINFFGTVNVTDTFLPLMLQTSNSPRIVFVSSRLGTHETVENPENKYANPSFTSYKCSRAALNMYAHNLAVWLSHSPEEAGGSAKAIKVNCAYPGFVKTDQSRHAEEAPLSPYEGAESIVRLATLPDDGPTGQFFHKEERLHW